MATLPTNFKDDILDTSVNTRRRYRVYENTDGTIELEDVTEYSQVGDVFGSGKINATNTEVNKKFEKNMIVRDIDTISAITKEGYVPDALALKDINNSLGTLSFGQDSEGNWGYKVGASTEIIPFKGAPTECEIFMNVGGSTTTKEITVDGILCFFTGNSTCTIKKNGETVFSGSNKNDFLPVNKGDTIVITSTYNSRYWLVS